ncbi:hypothetical protein Glove_767g8 [Diversispora epigaea]|uniref:Uncharacterized protein n=1 Tax=Diversispora epigaea TaxID=1348612 RepID=A0A397FZ77_9GLOM|nr:hypothetical protein Glove_767g8 [Diversispora epigaea]
MCQYMAGNKSGRQSKVGERYFEKFRTRFWKRPQKCHNRIPPPTYEEVSSMLSYRESPASQKDRSASPTCRILSRRGEVSNNASNIVNETREAKVYYFVIVK